MGSEFIKRLNVLPDTAPGVLYASIYSPGDTTVTPNSSSQLALGDGADVVNLDLSEVCGVAPWHDKLPTDPTVLSQVIFGLKCAPGGGAGPGDLRLLRGGRRQAGPRVDRRSPKCEL